MFVRALAAVGATGLALAVPAAAFAAPDYPADTATLTCSATQVAPSATFTCTVTATGGTDANLVVTSPGENASIAGTVTSAAKSITSGSASFTVTAPSTEGTLGISALVDGLAVAQTAQVEVDASLSATGFDSMPLAVGAGVLLVAGASVVFIAARRRSAQNA